MKIKFVLFGFLVKYGNGLLPAGLTCDEENVRELGEDRIINGVPSEKGTWPFIVRFGKKKPG